MPQNKMPRKRLIEKIDEVHHLSDAELVRRRQSWVPCANKTGQDNRIIEQLDAELNRRGIVPDAVNNVVPGNIARRVLRGE